MIVTKESHELHSTGLVVEQGPHHLQLSLLHLAKVPRRKTDGETRRNSQSSLAPTVLDVVTQKGEKYDQQCMNSRGLTRFYQKSPVEIRAFFDQQPWLDSVKWQTSTIKNVSSPTDMK